MSHKEAIRRPEEDAGIPRDWERKARLVAAMLFHRDELLVVLNRKHADDPVRPRLLIQPFGGGVDDGETDEAAARRELREEGGLDDVDLSFVRDLGDTVTTNSKLGDALVTIRSLVFVASREPVIPVQERRKLERVIRIARANCERLVAMNDGPGLTETVDGRELPASLVPNLRAYLLQLLRGETPWGGIESPKSALPFLKRKRTL